jgi:hypothetical protein
MDKYAKAFVKASMIYLGIGAMTGLCMVLWPDIRFTVTRVHTHINLLGFMAMIYGVGYHIFGLWKPVQSSSQNIQVWLANITLIGLSTSWILEASKGGTWHSLAILFGMGQVISVFLFIVNLWMSMVAQTEKS